MKIPELRTRYFVMKSDYSWAEVSKETYDTAGTDPKLIPNTATINSDFLVHVTVANIGLSELADLVSLMGKKT